MLLKTWKKKKEFFPNHFIEKIRNFCPKKKCLLFSILLASIPILNTLISFISIRETFGPEELMNVEEAILEKTSLLYPESLSLIYIVLLFKLFKNFKISRAYTITNNQQRFFSKFYRAGNFLENIPETKSGVVSGKLKSFFFFLNLILSEKKNETLYEKSKLKKYQYPSIFFYKKNSENTLNFLVEFSSNKENCSICLKAEFLKSIFRDFKKRKFGKISIRSSVFFYIFTKKIKHPRRFKNFICPFLGAKKMTQSDPVGTQQIIYPKKYYKILLETAHLKKFSQILFPKKILGSFFLKNKLYESTDRLRFGIIRDHKRIKKKNFDQNLSKKEGYLLKKNPKNKDNNYYDATKKIFPNNNFGFFVSRISFIVKIKENM